MEVDLCALVSSAPPVRRLGRHKPLVAYCFYILNGAILNTGISRNASTNVFFKQHDYIIEFFDYATVLKPSLNFTASVSECIYYLSMSLSEMKPWEIMYSVSLKLSQKEVSYLSSLDI